MLVFFISREETREGGTLHHSHCRVLLDECRQGSQKLGCFFQPEEAIAFATAQGSVPVVLCRCCQELLLARVDALTIPHQ